jgi:integrase
VSDSQNPAEKLPVPSADPGAIAPIDRPRIGGAHASDIAGAFARNTRSAYLSDWRRWEAFAAGRGRAAFPAPADLVRDFLVDEATAGRKLSVLRRRLAAMATVHRLQGAPFERSAPVIAFALRRLARERGTARTGRAEIMTVDLEAMLRVLPPSLQGMRDRCILLLAFASGLRRSELVALDVADVEWRRDGMKLQIRRSKTDQEGEGQAVGVLYGRRERTCPMRALKRWLEAAAIVEGQSSARCVG